MVYLSKRTGLGCEGGTGPQVLAATRGSRHSEGPAHHHIYGEGILGLEVLQPAQHWEHLLFPHLHRNQLLHQRRNLRRAGEEQG